MAVIAILAGLILSISGYAYKKGALSRATGEVQAISAALESYNYGVRNLLDVTAAQKVLAQARSQDILAQTQVLTALADLAFRAGDSIQANGRKPKP